MTKTLDKAWEIMELLTGMALFSKIQTVALIVDRREGEPGESFGRDAEYKRAVEIYDGAVSYLRPAEVVAEGEWESQETESQAEGSDDGVARLDDTLDSLWLSTRAINSLRYGHVQTIRQLVALHYAELVRIKNLGPTTAREIATELDRMNIAHQLHDPRMKVKEAVQ